MTSLTARVRAGTLIITALLLVGILTLNHWLLSGLLEDFVAARLEHDAEALLAAWEVTSTGNRALDPALVNPIYLQPLSGHYYRIDSGGQVHFSRSLWDEQLPPPPPPTIQSDSYRRVRGPAGQELLLVDRRYQKSGEEVVLSVAEDLSPLRAGLARLQQASAALVVVVGLMTLLAQQLAIRRGLAPLGRAQAQLRLVQMGELSRLDEEAPREVQPLVSAINRLADALEQRLQRSRHALGNLAHGIKTPLTALQRLLDTPVLADHPSLRADLEKQLLRIGELTERELRRARIAGAPRLGHKVALGSEVATLIQVLTRVHYQKALAIENRVPPDVECDCDRDDLLELLGNLLDNACKWARERVRITATTTAIVCQIDIEDDGPGIAPEQLADALHRGSRVDESRDGHGLGLAIVSDIVAQYGAELALAKSDALGGLAARVRLPRLTRMESVAQELRHHS